MEELTKNTFYINNDDKFPQTKDFLLTDDSFTLTTTQALSVIERVRADWLLLEKSRSQNTINHVERVFLRIMSKIKYCREVTLSELILREQI